MKTYQQYLFGGCIGISLPLWIIMLLNTDTMKFAVNYNAYGEGWLEIILFGIIIISSILALGYDLFEVAKK